jgi:choline-sulfatase
MRPANVLILMSDEHSRRILGCYGDDIVRTSTLDALAARGTRFVNAAARLPSACPRGASVGTGRYAHALGA